MTQPLPLETQHIKGRGKKLSGYAIPIAETFLQCNKIILGCGEPWDYKRQRQRKVLWFTITHISIGWRIKMPEFKTHADVGSFTEGYICTVAGVNNIYQLDIETINKFVIFIKTSIDGEREQQNV